MKQEKGNWKPYNVKAIASNVESVFKHQSISKLNNPTYNFIENEICFDGNVFFNLCPISLSSNRQLIRRI